MRNIYEKTETLSANGISYDGCISIAGVMEQFQDIVCRHTEEMGIGFSAILRENNAKWVITRIRFEIDRLPINNESIRVVTWPLKPGLIKFNRAFLMRDSAERDLVRAYSDWCIIDADSGMPIKTGALKNPIDEYIDDRCIHGRYSNLKYLPSEDEFCYEKTVRVSDLDLNSHVNNISYIRMATDCFSTAQMPKLHTFEMSYKRQCFENDTIKLYKRQTDGGYLIGATNNGDTVFTAAVNL